MSDALIIALCTIGGGFLGVLAKGLFDGGTNKRDILWQQLQSALTRLDALDKRHDDLLISNGELRATVSRLEYLLEAEKRTSGILEKKVGKLQDENVILRKALRHQGIDIELTSDGGE